MPLTVQSLYNAIFGLEMDCVISELCYIGKILQRNYGHFPIIFFVKCQVKKKIEIHNMTMFYPNKCYNDVCHTGAALYF